MAKTTVRTPEEEAARLERRREAHRQRMRRRRSDPEARAREVEARRRKRRDDSEARQRSRSNSARYYAEHREDILSASKRKRLEDPGLRVLRNFRKIQRLGRFKRSSDSDVGPYSPMREVDEPGSAAEGSDGSSLVGPSKATVTERPQSKGCQANLLSTGKSQKTASKGCQADFLSTEKPQKTVSKGCQTTGITRSQTQKTHADEIEQESRAAFLQPEKHSGSRKRPMPQDESTSRRASGPTTSSNICAYTPKRSRLSPTDASASR
ncbi:uncharacterized protein [Dermacentor albipictus]|uniref:uncharacterized protein isoform X1 n=1 Tax=Dermacentor albipictus TaxID=60249 RepID=UPI0038FBF216